MNRRIIFISLLVAFLATAGCDSGMLANHPVSMMKVDLTYMALNYLAEYVAYMNQSPTTVSGKVVLCNLNNTGNPNAKLTIRGKFESKIVYTDSDGNYTTNEIRPGNFTLTVNKQGYSFIPAEQTINLTASGATNVNFETMVTWDKKIGGSGWDKANSIIQTNDCSYIAAGYSDSHNSVGNKDFYIVKIDLNGNKVWEKYYGGSNSEISYSISKTRIDDYVVACGYSFSNTAGLDDFHVTKINVNNTTNGEWQKLYGGAGQEVAYSIKPTSDNGYIAAGYTDSEGSGGTDVKAIKLDADGNSMWASGIGVYGGGYSDSANTIIELSTGGYVLAGNREDDSGNYDIWIIKLNAAGSVLWDKIYDKGDFDDASDIRETSDGGFIVAGYTDQGVGHYWIMKLDINGDLEWEILDNKNYASALYSIEQTNDGGFIAAGRQYSFSTTDYDILVLKFNSNGELEWHKVFDGEYQHEDVARSIHQTSDGGYIVAGYTTTYANKTDTWFIKLNRDGEIKY